MPAKMLNGITLTNLTADPSGWAAGSIYFNTTTKTVRQTPDGVVWGDVSAAQGSARSFFFS